MGSYEDEDGGVSERDKKHPRASELNETVFNCSELGEYYDDTWIELNDAAVFSEMEENPNIMHPMVKKMKDEDIKKIRSQNGQLIYEGETDQDG